LHKGVDKRENILEIQMNFKTNQHTQFSREKKIYNKWKYYKRVEINIQM